MAQHEEPYYKHSPKEGEPKGELGPDCGHHCGVVTVGRAHQIKRHCPCGECHNGEQPAVVKIGNTGRVPHVT
jgi:hypothetical protein